MRSLINGVDQYKSPCVAGRAWRRVALIGLLSAMACNGTTEPGTPYALQGRWEGVTAANVVYEYVFQTTMATDTNPRTGNVAPVYDLAYVTTPGNSGSTSAWFEGGKAYWGNSSLGTVNNDTTMTVEANGLAPFVMHKR